MPDSIYEFGEYRLDCGRFELARDGKALRLERKPMELLILLASRQGQLVTRTEIAERLWSSEVFVDTEHGINTAIRKLRHLLRDDADQPRFIQTVTGMGYRFAAAVTVAEEVQDRRVEIPPQASCTDAATLGVEPALRKNSPRWKWIIFGACAAVGAGVIAVTTGSHSLVAKLLHPNAAPAITSIAVLPLDNLSGDPQQEYFADGMTDELITQLAKDSTLRIVSRTSVMQYKGVRKPLPEIAHALNVDGVLEGSISRSNNHIHLTLQLIRADKDAHVWAESYDRDAAGAINLPAEASEAISRYLGSYIARSATSARPVDPEAHDAYLRGRYLWWSGEKDLGFADFKRAIELQPDYALGWAGLASYYGASVQTGKLSPSEALGPALAASVRAVQLDDSQPEAHLSLCAALFMQWDFERADKECLRAIQLDPRFAEAYHFRSKMLSALNRHPEAIEAQKRASELDPVARPWAMARTYLWAGKFDEAIVEARQRLEGYPRNAGLLSALAIGYKNKGMEKEAEEMNEKQLQLSGNPQLAAHLHDLYAKGGVKAVAQWRIQDMETRSKHEYVPPIYKAGLYAQLGDRERTLSLLEDGFREHSPFLLWIQNEPVYDFLHTDPRYRLLIQRIGLPAAY